MPEAEVVEDGTVEQDVTETPVEPVPVVEALNPADVAGKTVPLKRKPLKVDGKPLRKVHVPVLATGELGALAARLGDNQSMTHICAVYCDLHPSVVSAMHPDDFADLQETVFDFLPRFMREAISEFRAQVRKAAEQATEATSD